MMKEITDEYIHKKQQQLEKKLKGIFDRLFSSTTPQDYNFEMSSRSISYNRHYRIDCKTKEEANTSTSIRMFCDIIKDRKFVDNPSLFIKSSSKNFKFLSNIPFSFVEDMRMHAEILLDSRLNTIEQYLHIHISHSEYSTERLMNTHFNIKEREGNITVHIDNSILKKIYRDKKNDCKKAFEIGNNNQLTNLVIFLNILYLCNTLDNKKKIVELLGYKEDEWDTSKLFGKTLENFLQRDTESLSKTYQLIQMVSF